ncbi:MAG TPA: hypothetical protein VLL07_00775, partial [Pontiella sp.]|nr:hypothetical protein [Pontiella sp.]
FARTADQSLIEQMDALRLSPEFDALDPIEALDMSMRILEMKNDQAGLKKLPLASVLQADHVFDEKTSSGIRHSYLTLMGALLDQDREAAIPEQSSRRAELILQRLKQMPRSLQCEHTGSLMVQAYVTLGRQDEAWAVVKKMFDEEGQGFPGPTVGFALAMLDPDQTAARMLAARELYPSWNGMDYTAIYCLAWRDVVIHPDIQAYYVKEGKWIDYLAERVPEYAQYRK